MLLKGDYSLTPGFCELGRGEPAMNAVRPVDVPGEIISGNDEPRLDARRALKIRFFFVHLLHPAFDPRASGMLLVSNYQACKATILMEAAGRGEASVIPSSQAMASEEVVSTPG